MAELLKKLKNKITYRGKEWLADTAYDPEAEEAAKQEQAAQDAKTAEKHAAEKATSHTGTAKSAAKDTEPEPKDTAGKVKQILKKIYKRLTDVLIAVIIPLLLASFVANESIVYPVPVRIAFFLFTLVLCMASSMVMGVLGVFYVGKFAWDYYVNQMVEPRPNPKRLIMPTFFALLPITSRQPETKKGAFFMYPFRYPKTGKDEDALQQIMDEYKTTIKEHFPYLEKMKSMPVFATAVTAVEEMWEKMTEEAKVKPMPWEQPAPMPPVIEESHA